MQDGSERDVDVVVCATGYAAADYLGEIEVAGEGGLTLREVWRDGAHAYLGMAVPQFPNFFMLYGPNTNVGSNSVIFVLEAQARYVVRALRYLRRRRKAYVAVKPAAMASFLGKIDQWMSKVLCGPPSAATTFVQPMGAWSHSGRAAPARSGG